MTPDLWEVTDDVIVPAERFRRHGINVFPAHGKDPAVPKDTSWKGWRGPVGRDFGVELSARLGVLDTDERDDELWVLQQIALRVIPDTPFRVATGPYHDGTPGRGRHRLFQLAGALPKYIRRDGHVIEFRNEGQYVIGAGSRHPSGVIYTADEWSWRWDDIPFFPPDFVFGDGSCPQTSSGGAGGEFVLPDEIHPKFRHDTLHKLMRALVAHGLGLDGAREVCYAINRAHCRPPLDVDATRLEKFLDRAYYQKDRADFVRAPKTGWLLAGALLEIGLPVDVVIAAVRTVTPDFDPETAE